MLDRRKFGLLRRRREGMTLVEIMIVVIIMALIATGVSLAVIPQVRKARIKDTRTNIQAVRSAVTLWQQDHANECPTVEQLTQSGELDRSKRTTDAWDNPFQITCEGDEIVVSSRGPDGQEGTEDDIR
ncbi:MAG: type II secretion system protein GspG [Deltaproteobacteria bacterium]|nr:type II secretion system protein GspG [Deltaproteobacteria bacterium]